MRDKMGSLELERAGCAAGDDTGVSLARQTGFGEAFTPTERRMRRDKTVVGKVVVETKRV